MARQKSKVSEADLETALEELKQEFEALTTEENQMAKAKAKTLGSVNKLSDKLVKVNENFTINMYDNGYMIEVGGRDNEDNWKTAKIMVGTVEELLVLVREATEIERAD
jgi:phage-related minor tail protein